MQGDIFQSLWIGSKLSRMEQLTIRSYLANGHEFHLYLYDTTTPGIPEGTTIRSASEIIPFRDVFAVRGGYSTFSDFFRWKLILDRGGWWTDLDAVCLRPFDFEDDYVFFGGTGLVGSNDCITSGIFKAPAGSDILQWGWLQCQTMNPKTMAWGAAGPPLFTEAVQMFKMRDYVVPGQRIFPVFYTEAPDVFLQECSGATFPKAYSIHLFNEMWRLAGKDKDVVYRNDCLYELLQERFK